MAIRWRLTLYIALVIGAILLVLGFALYFLSRSVLLSGVEDTARSRATAAAKTIESGKRLSDAYVGQLTLDGVVLLIRDERGGVVRKVNLPENGKIENFLWSKAESSEKPASGMATLSGDDPYFIYAVPVHTRAGVARVVEVASPYEFAQHALETFGTVLVVGIGVAFLLSIGGAYFLAGAALRPVDAVTSAAREMGEGDLSTHLPVANAKDEVGRLAITINGLLSRLEAAFGRREEALERQRRFAADASHELRTPLTSISGHARMLDEWAIDEDPERAKRSASAIRAAAGRMRNLIESLLVLTRGDESTGLEVGRYDLAAVADEAAQAAQTAADGRVSVEYVRPKRAVEATFDRDRIFQVASILLDNAVKYTQTGGNAVVRVGEDGDRAVLEVSDTGIGIPEDQLPLVFERFYRTDHSRTDGGVGLGLSIARQIAEAHGGEIRARSAFGEGSTFKLYLPYRKQPHV
ncbi:MAG: HAMP domain-containing histidine kinase [Rubrobacteraceae bacterium]|nr:HAMP domain-containing histidine kinase [Rubrobacteraceae bacterium]